MFVASWTWNQILRTHAALQHKHTWQRRHTPSWPHGLREKGHQVSPDIARFHFLGDSCEEIDLSPSQPPPPPAKGISMQILQNPSSLRQTHACRSRLIEDFAGKSGESGQSEIAGSFCRREVFFRLLYFWRSGVQVASIPAGKEGGELSLFYFRAMKGIHHISRLFHHGNV